MTDVMTRSEMQEQFALDREALGGLEAQIDQAARRYHRPEHHLDSWEAHHRQALGDLREAEAQALQRLDAIERRAMAALAQVNALRPRIALTEAQRAKYNSLLPQANTEAQAFTLVELDAALRLTIFENDLPSRLAWSHAAQARLDTEREKPSAVRIADRLDQLAALIAKATPSPPTPAPDDSQNQMREELIALGERSRNLRKRVTEARVNRRERPRLTFGRGAVVPFPDRVEDPEAFDPTGYHPQAS